MHVSHPFGDRWPGERADPGLNEFSIVGEIDFGDTLGSGKPALVLDRVPAHRTKIVKRALFAAHDPVPGGEVCTRSITRLCFKSGLIETRRQHIDQIDVARELAVLLLGNAARDEDAEMTDCLVNGVDDRLPVIPDLIDVAVEV